MIYYKLDKTIVADKIIKDISKLIEAETNLDSKVLVISIKNIINQMGDPLIPKIQHHE